MLLKMKLLVKIIGCVLRLQAQNQHQNIISHNETCEAFPYLIINENDENATAINKDDQYYHKKLGLSVTFITIIIKKWQDGRKIDSSRDRGQPFQFNIGRQEVVNHYHHHCHHPDRNHSSPISAQSQTSPTASIIAVMISINLVTLFLSHPSHQVIAGWDEGVAKMSKGQRAKLTISSDMGYGANGVPGQIPGGATLIFDVELINVS